MKRFYMLMLMGLLLQVVQPATAQTFWDGPKMTFVKADSADWTLAENQDRITDVVWITRQHKWSIFNIAQGDITEITDCDEDPGQPYDTEWAFGTIADGVENLTFDNFLGDNFTSCGPGGPNGGGVSPVNMDAVLHLISEDIYIDIKFLSWSNGNDSPGGGFSYERSTDPTSSTAEIEPGIYVTLYPNPAQQAVRIMGLESPEAMRYQIYNTMGAVAQSGLFSPQASIDIANLPKGVYYFRIGDYQLALKFVKA